MPTFNDIRNAVNEWMQQNSSTPGGFFQTRVTRTPGAVMQPAIPNAGATYTKENPAGMVSNSNIDPAIAALLSRDWANQGNGFIRLSPTVAGTDQESRVLRHEQVHRVFDTGDLVRNAQSITPLIDPGIMKYLATSPMYKGNDVSGNTDEGLAFQLSASPEHQLANQIAVMLNSKGKANEADQIKRLTK